MEINERAAIPYVEAGDDSVKQATIRNTRMRCENGPNSTFVAWQVGDFGRGKTENRLAVDNMNTVSVSTNLENLKLICKDCQNKE